MASPLGREPPVQGTGAMAGVGTPQTTVAAQSKEQLKAKFLSDFEKQADALREHYEDWHGWTKGTYKLGFITFGAAWVVGLLGQIYFFGKYLTFINEKKAMALTEGATKVPFMGQILTEALLSRKVINAEKNVSEISQHDPKVTPEKYKERVDRHITNLKKDGDLPQHTVEFLLKNLTTFKSFDIELTEANINNTELRQKLAEIVAMDQRYQAIKELEYLKKQLDAHKKNIYGIKT